MDFSNQYHFSQPYQHFVAVPPPPLTPSHSHSTASDDYNRTSPPEHFDGLPQADNFSGFDFSDFNNPRFPGPPTPPTNYAPQPQEHSANGIVPDCPMKPNAQSAFANHDSSHEDLAAQARNGSEEDDNLTPSQARRKAQNRAAQRAFRERKEKHVKDLEAKLADMEAAQQQASKENQRLKREMQTLSTENHILRATSNSTGNNPHQRAAEPTTTGPLRYNPTDFYSNVLQDHPNKHPSHRIVTSEDGQRLLAAGAAWDLIISHDLFKRGLVNVGELSERLKPCSRCDGQGPVFAEGDILRVIEQSVASGTDDLL